MTSLALRTGRILLKDLTVEVKVMLTTQEASIFNDNAAGFLGTK